MSTKNLSKNVNVEPTEEEVNNINGNLRNDGLYEKALKVTSKTWPASVRGTALLDFTNIPQEQLLEWASRSLIITLQRSLRSMNYEGAKALLAQPLKRNAAEVGIGIASPEKQVNKARALLEALPPEMRQQIMNEFMKQ